MKKVAFLQFETKCFSGSTTLFDYCTSEFYDEIAFYQIVLPGCEPLQGQFSQIETLKCHDSYDLVEIQKVLKEYDTIIVNPDLILYYVNSNNVPWISVFKELVNQKFIIIVHNSVKGLKDSIWNILEPWYKERLAAGKIEFWSITPSYTQSYKDRLGVEELPGQLLKYSSLALDDKNIPQGTVRDEVTFITRDTMNRLYSAIPYIRYPYGINVILSCKDSKNFRYLPVDLNYHYYVNLQNVKIKNEILDKSKFIIIGSLYDQGLHIAPGQDSGYDWSIVEGICHGCIPIVTPEFRSMFERDGITAFYIDPKWEQKYIELDDGTKGLNPAFYADIARQIDSVLDNNYWDWHTAERNQINLNDAYYPEYQKVIRAFTSLLD